MTQSQRALAPIHRLPDPEIERLLVTGERRVELEAMLGDAAYRELSRLARRAAATRPRARRPVYVLPGLMGSRIGTRGRVVDDVLWVDVVEIAAGHLVRLALPRGSRLAALGVMLLNSLKLKLSLQIAGFNAKFHAFDWRLGIDALAQQLVERLAADRVEDAQLVGHSMGGLVARSALALADGRISRVVQIGAPNFGSFAPVLALRGVYPTVRKLAALDLRHSAEDYARLIFRTLPSLHELLPSPVRAPDVDLFDVASWPDDDLRPEASMLTAGHTAQLRWPRADPRCLHVVGIRQDTVTAVHRKRDGFEFVVTAEGDGTVPLSMAVLPGSQTWYVAEKHGGLPNNGRVISAVVDLLRTGSTQRLQTATRAPHRRRRAVARTVSEAALRRVAPHKVRWQELSADARRRLLEPVVSPEFHGAVAAESLRGSATEAVATPRVLEIRLSRRSIVDADARAIVLGVIRNVDPSGAAAAVDAKLGGAVRELTLRRMFTGQLGQVFVLPTSRTDVRAEFVVFVGVGAFDKLDTEALTFAADNAARTLARAHVNDVATVLIGAGSGIPIAQAFNAQIDGLLTGLRAYGHDGQVQRVTICELDTRKYRSLRAAAHAYARTHGDLGGTLRVIDDTPPVRRAKRKRAAAITRTDPAYLLVTAVEQGRDHVDYRTSLLTAGAKASVLSGRRDVAQSELSVVLEPLSDAAPPPSELAMLGQRLTRLLVAPSVREGLADVSTRALVVVHDREAAQVPWEVLHDGSGFPALGRGLSRRYASDTLTPARWRASARAGQPRRVLIVADPTEDLPSAREEGAALQSLLHGAGVQVRLLLGEQATRSRILRALAAEPLDALHFAGHAYFVSSNPAHGGLVCANDEVLRGSDLDGQGDLPALVFFNACEAARVRRRARSSSSSPHLRSRPVSVAEAFLAGGVANFIGTHWPVGDAAAGLFATSLYTRLVGGDDLGTAILASRRLLQARGLADWADYVHYGNPVFVPLASRNDPQ
jgi:CHAT domain-containing protein/pimeloyl-ACP methyl ester carboxylesterase